MTEPPPTSWGGGDSMKGPGPGHLRFKQAQPNIRASWGPMKEKT